MTLTTEPMCFRRQMIANIVLIYFSPCSFCLLTNYLSYYLLPEKKFSKVFYNNNINKNMFEMSGFCSVEEKWPAVEHRPSQELCAAAIVFVSRQSSGKVLSARNWRLKARLDCKAFCSVPYCRVEWKYVLVGDEESAVTVVIVFITFREHSIRT